MAVMSDKWIRKMAQTKGMIEPFEFKQVNQRNGTRILSYGTSSYGYDIRCAPEFKIFTNVNNALIDPKNFTEKTFVSVNADEIIIPPNSFVLTRSLEYIRVPRDVLVVCLGKSTLARCFTGDTRIALVDGTTISFTEMIERSKTGERFWGYSVTPENEIGVAELTAPRKIGHEPVLEVTLDSGEKIRCTKDHEFLSKSGEWVQAKDLTEGFSLEPLYRSVSRDYEAVWQPDGGYLRSTHHLSDEWNVRHGIYGDVDDFHRHHKNHVRRDNRPTNIERVNSKQHHLYHNDLYWTDEAKQRQSEVQKEVFKNLSQDPEWLRIFCERSKKAAHDFWNSDAYAKNRLLYIETTRERMKNLTPEQRQILSDRARKTFNTAEHKAKASAQLKRMWADPEFRKFKLEQLATANVRLDITEENLRAALASEGSIRRAARKLNCDRSTFRRFAELVLEAKDRWITEKSNFTQEKMLACLKQYGSVTKTAAALSIGRNTIRKKFSQACVWFFEGKIRTNHKVISVIEIEGTHDVYCLTAPEFGNFALADGVFVKNCGVDTMVTPLEPEWEGHITLEFANTTSLPMKFYANEGCAQLLFFEGNEPCDVSYLDRGGKYQGQRGVTTPIF